MTESISLAGRTLVSDGSFLEVTVSVHGQHIDAIQDGIDPHADIVTSGWIVPGLIDLQTNGGFGFDVTADPTTASALAARLPATGVTSFLPTVISSPLESYPPLLRALAQSIHGVSGEPGVAIRGAASSARDAPRARALCHLSCRCRHILPSRRRRAALVQAGSCASRGGHRPATAGRVGKSRLT